MRLITAGCRFKCCHMLLEHNVDMPGCRMGHSSRVALSPDVRRAPATPGQHEEQHSGRVRERANTKYRTPCYVCTWAACYTPNEQHQPCPWLAMLPPPGPADTAKIAAAGAACLLHHTTAAADTRLSQPAARLSRNMQAVPRQALAPLLLPLTKNLFG